MTSGIVFILHGPADAAYAAELADALSPHLAFPVALSPDTQRPTQYGAGAVCAVLWTQEAAARGLTGEVARAMHGAVSNAIVCRFGQTPLPHEFSANACVQVQPQANSQDAAAPLRAAIERRLLDWDERNTGPRRSAKPSLGAAVSQAPAASSGGGRMVVRSAWGLAATMAVVGVAAPVVSDRAGAANIQPDQASAPNEATVVGVAADVTAQPMIDAGGDLVEATAAPVSYPDPDPLIEALVAQPEPTVVQMPHEDAALTDAPEPVVAVAAFDAPEQLDSKTSEVIAAMVAGADVADWKIEAAAPPPVRHEKPGAALQASAKPASGV